MANEIQFQIKSYVATAALDPYVRVKKDGTTDNVVVAGAGEVGIGVTMANVAAGGVVPVRLFNGYGTAFMKASAAIAKNAPVYGTALGKIDDAVAATNAGAPLGYAEEAATATGDIIEVLLRGSLPLEVSASADQGVVTITATNPTAPAAYAAVVNMTDPVTKAEGEAVSAALAALRTSVAAYELTISALVVDVTALNTLVTSLRTALIANGTIKGAA